MTVAYPKTVILPVLPATSSFPLLPISIMTLAMASTTNLPPATLGLFNLAWLKEMHLDGGINNIKVQPLAQITALNKMAEDINNVIKKLQADSAYPKLFRVAYGDATINSQRMLFAITQFVGSLVSANSKYDKVKRGELVYTDGEKNGYLIFPAKCTGCHKESLFTDFSYRNTGIPVRSYINDYGRMRITNKKEDSLKFKVPSLRNVLSTFP